MATYVYDGSFEGLLSCVFNAFSTRRLPHAIVAQDDYHPELLDDAIHIIADETQAERVLKAINQQTDGEAAALAYKIFLSELPQAAMTLFHIIKVIVSAKNTSILKNFGNSHILEAAQIEKKIHREIHRMHAFVRFQKTNTGLFYAVIEPDFNVMPLLGEHFEKRYADQTWVIFDSKRQYGLYYQQQELCFINADHPVVPRQPKDLQSDILDSSEKLYQSLWINYFHSVNIQQRNNKKLHQRHMPRRYWKYLIEKSQPGSRPAVNTSYHSPRQKRNQSS
ncbi:MAG TPA: TIGR03915 family putative DNA repair protein [Cellvibrio sp.]|nr:TIGR03915 family putative DNA repair protein [Cellvibrio sp.]